MQTAADVLLIDLEDSVAPERKAAARALVRAFLADHPGERRSQLWVRINALDHPEAGADLGAVLATTHYCCCCRAGSLHLGALRCGCWLESVART